MKDEIKETLDKLKIKNDRYSYYLKHNMSYEYKDEDYEAHLLFDHITNLQEVNKKLQDRNIELVLERDRLNENNKSMQEEMARTWKKIDNATEYMNNYIETEESNEPVKIEFKVVRNILNGDDKE